MLKKKEKQNEKDEYHKEFGVFRNLAYIFSAFCRYRKSIILFLILGGIAGASMSYVWTFIGKLVIDMIQQQMNSPDKDIQPLLFLIIITTIVELIMMWLNGLCEMKLNVGFIYIRLMLVRERILKALSMDYEMLENPDMLDRLQKAKRATDGDWYGVHGMMSHLRWGSVVVVSLFTAVSILSTFNPLIILVIGILSVVQFLYFDHIRKLDKKEMWDAMMPFWRKLRYMQQVSTDFSFAKDIRLFGMKHFLGRKHKEVNDIELQHWIKSRTYWMKNSAFSHVVSLIRDGVALGWLVYSVLFQDLSIGNFTLYYGSISAFSHAINEVLMMAVGMRERSAQTDDFRSFMEKPNSDTEAKNTPLPKDGKYIFTFQNVSFRYKGQDTYALKNLNLTIEDGHKLAVVGLNGAGKSTFIKLLLRLYDVTEGRILLNGIDIREFNRTEYYTLFAPVFQDVMVFAFPMSENVSMSAPEETDVVEAEQTLIQAGLSEKIETLDKGIQTELLKVLYDDGVDLSGGEKQKLALARALYKKAPVVVLDEPTAALDALAEYKLYQSFDGMIGDKTAVYISHRLSSTRFCDSIVMFVAGEMVERGTHEELLEKDGAYAEMFRVQAQYYVADKDVIMEGGAVCEA